VHPCLGDDRCPRDHKNAGAQDAVGTADKTGEDVVEDANRNKRDHHRRKRVPDQPPHT